MSVTIAVLISFVFMKWKKYKNNHFFLLFNFFFSEKSKSYSSRKGQGPLKSSTPNISSDTPLIKSSHRMCALQALVKLFWS